MVILLGGFLPNEYGPQRILDKNILFILQVRLVYERVRKAPQGVRAPKNVLLKYQNPLNK